jgi:hypothetical protein
VTDDTRDGRDLEEERRAAEAAAAFATPIDPTLGLSPAAGAMAALAHEAARKDDEEGDAPKRDG